MFITKGISSKSLSSKSGYYTSFHAIKDQFGNTLLMETPLLTLFTGFMVQRHKIEPGICQFHWNIDVILLKVEALPFSLAISCKMYSVAVPSC